MSKARQEKPIAAPKSSATLLDKKAEPGTEPKKPLPVRADATPTEGYVLAVDGKLKTHFADEADATAAATKLKQSFPVIQVSVYDAVKRSYTPIELPGK